MRVVEGIASISDVGSFISDIDAIGDRHGVTVQAFDARYVVDRAHLERAVESARRARDRGDTIAEDFGVEILLYAAGRRQINRALTMGVKEGECPIVAVVVGGDESEKSAAVRSLGELLTSAETLGAYDSARVQSFFDVSEKELDATAGRLADAVRERVALLPVEK